MGGKSSEPQHHAVRSRSAESVDLRHRPGGVYPRKTLKSSEQRPSGSHVAPSGVACKPTISSGSTGPGAILIGPGSTWLPARTKHTSSYILRV